MKRRKLVCLVRSLEARLDEVEHQSALTHGAVFGCPRIDVLGRFYAYVDDDGVLAQGRVPHSSLMARVRLLEGEWPHADSSGD